MNNSKKCKICNQEKELISFRKRKENTDGYTNQCIECLKLKDKNRYENNRDKVLERSKEYFKNNRDKILERFKEYRKTHPRDRKEYHKNWRERKKFEEKIHVIEKTCSVCLQTMVIESFNRKISNKDGYRECCKICQMVKRKKYYNENKDKISEKSKLYYDQNKEWFKAYQREWQKNERKNNPLYVLRSSVGRKIRKMLGGAKNSSVTKILPYTIKQLKEHLESQFDKNMSWDNYGLYWEVDHIYPQSLLSYDSLDHPNFLKCWSLDNLRPLEKIENRKKGNKIIDI